MGRSAETLDDIAERYERITAVDRVSDGLIKIGPFGIGLDALVGLAPVLGSLYTLGAGALIVSNAQRCYVSGQAVFLMISVLLADLLVTLIPGLGDIGDFFLRGHNIAARVARHEIENTKYYEGSKKDVPDPKKPRRYLHINEIDGKTPTRTVYLGDRYKERRLVHWVLLGVIVLAVLKLCTPL